MDKHIIYVHTFPNGKKYVGQCKGESMADAKERWRNGFGYKSQMVFRAIVKFGWVNVKHEILKVVEGQEEADRWERYFILLWNTTDRDCGYNMNNGGDDRGYERKIKTTRPEAKPGTYYQRNKEKVQAYQRANKEKIKEYSRRYYQEHKEQYAKMGKERNEYHREYNRNYYRKKKQEKILRELIELSEDSLLKMKDKVSSRLP